MIEPRDHFVRGLDRRCIRRHGPAQHDHLDAERTRRADLAIARNSAAVLGNQHIYLVRAHQCSVTGFAERTAIGDITDTRQRQWRLDRIDAADQIKVPRRGSQRPELGAAERNKGAARSLAEQAHRVRDVRRLDPAVAGNCAPWRTAQGQQRHTSFARRRGGIPRNNVGIGMCCIDKRADPFVAQIVSKTGSAAEPAAANGHRLQRRRFGASGQRYNDIKICAPGQAFGQFARFGRTTEDKDA